VISRWASGDIQLASANHRAQPMLELVFHFRWPFLLERPPRLGPEVLVIISAAELGRPQ
jgi:hypothetical protein